MTSRPTPGDPNGRAGPSGEQTPLVLTMGEPAGIGGEIALAAWLRRASQGLSPFVLLDDPERLRALAGTLGWQVPIEEVATAAAAPGVFSHALPVLPQRLAAKVTPGQPSPKTADAVIGSIDRAVRLVRDGEGAAVVTNPIAKSALYAAGFAHAGHTEYLAARAGDGGAAPVPIMMLVAPGLRAVPVTIHVPFKEVPRLLDRTRIEHAGRVTAAALLRDFDVAAPRLAVSGLNPHAGESGTMGREEIDTIAPAIETLRAEGLDVRGPLPGDTMFHAEARAGYDAAVCMYHDQALIPIKTLDFARGVNVTLGLPFVRTSPDHGTALAIAGTGRADPTSLIEALTLARRLAANRGRHASTAA